MEKHTEKAPGFKDLPQLLEKVPIEHKENITELTVAMMNHEAYGKPYDWSTEDFELGAPLGRGKFGRVYVARERKTGFLVAMKIMFKNELEKSKLQRQVLHEIEIQTHLKHPNILRMYTWFHDDERIYMVMEIAAGGELYAQMRKTMNRRFDEPRSAKYIYQVADALNYCHSKNVIHRDLKPENLLLTSTDDIKLSDFGWASHGTNNRKTMCGTLFYLPPEIVRSEVYNNAVDLWCLGVLSYELLTGHVPFDAQQNKDVYEKIKYEEVSFPTYLSAGAKELISLLMRKPSSLRIALDEVMRHPWVVEQKGLDFVKDRSEQLSDLNY